MNVLFLYVSVHIERKGSDLQQLGIYQLAHGMIADFDEEFSDSLSDTALLASRQQVPQRRRRHISVRQRRDTPDDNQGTYVTVNCIRAVVFCAFAY